MYETFLRWAQYDKPEDMVFSRVHSSRLRETLFAPEEKGKGLERKRYLQSGVNSLIKEVAVHFGFSASRFSTKSFKYAGITTTQSNKVELGFSDQDVANQFDHKSISSSRCYQAPAPVETSLYGPLSLLDKGKVYAHKNLESLELFRTQSHW